MPILPLVGLIALVMAAFLILPAGVTFLAITGVAVGAGVLSAGLRRDAGPRFRPPVFIGR